MVKHYWPKKLLDKPIKDGGPNRYPFHRAQFLNLFRLALLFPNQTDDSALSDEERKEIIVTCLLAINSLSLRERTESCDVNNLRLKLEKSGFKDLTTADIDFFTNWIKILFTEHGTDLPYTIARYKEMILDCPHDPEFNPRGLDKLLLEDLIIKKLGLTLKEYVSLSFAVMSKYLVKEGLFKNPAGCCLDAKNYLVNSAMDPEVVQAYFSAIAQSDAEFREKELKSKLEPRDLGNFTSFMAKPFVHFGDFKLFPVSMNLIQALIDNSLFWVVKGDADFDYRMSNYFGRLFEHYCHKICTIIAASMTVKQTYIALEKYVDGSVCDGAMVSGDSVVLFEYKKKPLKATGVIKGELDAFEEDVTLAFVDSAKQIEKTIAKIKSGSLIKIGLDPQNIRHFFPVTVTYHTWPIAPFTYDYIRGAIRRAGLLRDSSVAPFEIISIRELEEIETIFTAMGFTVLKVSTVFSNKLTSEFVDSPFDLYLKKKFTGETLRKNPRIQSLVDDVFKLVLSTIKMQPGDSTEPQSNVEEN